MPVRYRYQVLDNRVLLGIDSESIHFLNNRYLDNGCENKGEKEKADKEAFFKGNHSFSVFVFGLEAK